ncbi:MAG: flagellar hook-length control protein FliK [Candidatus Aquilonibacter sp.]
MSGLDPLAALAAQAVANAQAAIDAATLSLGADVATLQAQVNVGDVIAATVLPPQAGTDLLSFLGQTVAAQIPPGIDPGETLLLQVTGFTNSTVTVRNLGTIDPENPIPTVNPDLTPPVTDGPQAAVLSTQVAPAPSTPEPSSAVPVQNAAVPSASVPTANVPTALPPVVPPAPNVAPPREVFVAASVRSNLAANARTLAAQIEEAITSNDVEARLAANRASAPPPPTGPSAQSPSGAQRGVPLPPAASNAAPPSAASPSSRFPVAPPIVQPASNLPVSQQTPAPAQGPAPAPAPVLATPLPRQSVPATPEGELLARLGVPITPATLAAARSVNTATQSVTAAYERLEGLLARIAPESAGALRSMLAFVARFDLRNSRALPEQIATFVSDVLDGAESKIVQSVAAWTALETEPSANTPAQAPSTQPATPVAVNAAAQAAERAAAMEYDVKSAILAMIASSSRDGSPQIAGALRDALTATTALQLNVLSSQSSDPRTIAIPLPAYFYEGGEPVQMRISRDAPNGKNAMDADNFHIAFILDTKSLGTVAIDLQTVGRAVSVEVKTQATPAADRFRSTLNDLRSRLEGLRYRISSIGAGVAPPSGAVAPASESAQSSAPAERKSFWDTRA